MSNRTCTVDGCGAPHRSRGFCGLHYKRWLKFGSTDDPRPSLEDLFWAKVDMTGDCWLWTACRDNATGYGRVGRGGTTYLAHRMAYELVHGAIPDGMQVDHTCFTRRCVRPEHLRAVTHKQNQEHRRGANRDGAAGHRGVSPTRNGTWRAAVVHDGHQYLLGTYTTPEAAAEAARLKRLELYTHNDVDRVA